MINMALASNDAPEIFEAQDNPPVVTLAKAGHIIPIDDLFDDAFKAKFHPSAFAQKDLYYEGKLYSVPNRFSAYKLLYNKTLFKAAGLDPEEPPKTWEEVREYAKKITEAGKGNFYGFGLYVNYQNVWLRHVDVPIVSQGEGGMTGFDYITGKFDFSNSKKYFDYWVELYNDGSIFPGALSLGVEQMRANFAQGMVGMTIDGNWMSSQYSKTEGVVADWTACEIPVFEGEKTAKSYMVGE
jgi:multiple sugar transport system substrate-binding protein